MVSIAETRTIRGNGRLNVRLLVNFLFSASMNNGTRRVQAAGKIGRNDPEARVNFGDLGAIQGSDLWVPSQKGAFLECLQAHQATVLGSVMSTFLGAKPVPL